MLSHVSQVYDHFFSSLPSIHICKADDDAVDAVAAWFTIARTFYVVAVVEYGIRSILLWPEY